MPLARITPHSAGNGTAVSTNVSQGSRADSKPVGYDHRELETLVEEFDRLSQEMLDADAELSQYNDARMLKEQNDCRKKYGNNINKWVARKHELDTEKKALIAKKLAMQKRRTAIKPKAMEAKRLLLRHVTATKSDSARPMFQEMIDLLREIRDRLPPLMQG